MSARRPMGRRGARHLLRREGGQGLDRPLARAHHPRRGPAAHQPRGQRVEPGREPGREVDRVRGEAGRGREPADLPDSPGGGRGPAPHESSPRGPRRRSGSRTAGGWPSSAACGPTSRPGTRWAKRQKERKDAKMTARVFDQAPTRYWDHWLDDQQAHVYTIGIEGGEPKPVTLGTGLQLSKQEVDASSYDISPDGAEIAFAADSDKTGIDSNFDVYVIPAEGGTPRTSPPTTRPTTAGRSTAPTDVPSPSAGRSSRASTATVCASSGTTGRRGRTAWSPRRSTGRCGIEWAPDGAAALRHRRRRRARPRLPHRHDVGRGQGGHEGASSFTSLDLVEGRHPCWWPSARGSPSRPPSCGSTPSTGAATKLSTFNDTLFERVAWGTLRERHLQGFGREGHPDVGELPGRTSTRRRSGRCTCCSTAGPTTG